MSTTRRRLVVLLAVPLVLAVSYCTNTDGFGLPSGGIQQMRTYQLLQGLIVGAALATAGVIFQAVLRNPLAEPYLLGVSSGAGLAAVLVTVTGVAATSVFARPLAAFLGGAITLATVYALANDKGRPSIYGLILSGVIVSSVCSSLLMLIISTHQWTEVRGVFWWMLGDLQVTSVALLRISGVTIMTACIITWLVARELNALALGRDAAHHVGVRTSFVVLALTLATLLSATAVAMAGLIGFVGLVVPHVVRSLVGPDHRILVPYAALCGGVFLVVCDTLARVALAPIMLRVGVVTALCGGPFFLIILRRRKQGWIE